MHTQKLPAPPMFGTNSLPTASEVLIGGVLSLIALAFAIGIAGASSFPAEAGIISAIVGGTIGAFWCRVPPVICGPAAALAPILAMSVGWLGEGDLQLGYERTLVVIFMTGCFMQVVGFLGWARIIQRASDELIHGMLASIAFILLSSRLSTMTGVKLHGHTLHERVFELSEHLHTINLAVFGISILTLVMLIICTMLKSRAKFLQLVPPQALAIPFIIMLSVGLGLPIEHRVALPENLLSGLSGPDWSMLLDPRLLGMSLVLSIILTTVDTTESICTAVGIGKLDVHERDVCANRITIGMGVANVISSLVGGMSNIPGGAKSTTALTMGVKTIWPALLCVGFIILWVTLGRGVVNLLAEGGLAMVVIFSVMKLSSPKVWRTYYERGVVSFSLFAITFAGSVMTNDIIIGLAAGGILQMGLWLYRKRTEREKSPVAAAE